MIILQDILKNRQEVLADLSNKKQRKGVKLPAEVFRAFFEVEAQIIMRQRRSTGSYVYTDEVKYLLNQMYYYITDDVRFAGNLQKGIIIQGANGTGKSLLLSASLAVYANLTNRVINTVSARSITGIEGLETKPIIIDDIGKEGNVINDFGTKKTPMIDLIDRRYEEGALTFATTNYNLESLESKYSTTITDRMHEMFNFFILKGESFRKKV